MTTTLVVKTAATLANGHPLGQILVQQEQADTMDTVASAAAQASGALLLAGEQDFGAQTVGGGGAGLTAAGVAAVLSAWNTYLSGLSAAKKAQIGFLRASVASSGLCLAVHVADVAAQASALQTVLNTGANYGPVGS